MPRAKGLGGRGKQVDTFGKIVYNKCTQIHLRYKLNWGNLNTVNCDNVNQYPGCNIIIYLCKMLPLVETA